MKALQHPLRAVVVAVALTSASVQAATIYSNNFSSDTVDQEAIGLYSYSSNAAASAPLVATNNAAPLSGNVLRFGGGTGTSINTVAVGAISAVTLANAGDYIAISMDYRFFSTVTGNNSGPLLGLYNNGGTAFTQNYFGADASKGGTADDKGYEVSKFINISGSPNASASDFKFLARNESLYAPSFFTFQGIAQTTSSGIGAQDLSSHSISMTLTRQANGDLLITGTFDTYSGGYTIAAASVLTYTFNQFNFTTGGGLASNNAYVDNLLITSNAVPEPTTLALTALGGLSLLFLRRPSRKV